MAQIKILSKVGSLYAVASNEGLVSVSWQRQKIPTPQKGSVQNKILNQVEKQIHEYEAGLRKDFDLPLDLQGTAFQKRVWKRLTRIPFGKTKSYKDIALELQIPGASRAVGNANGKNPICLIIPCHRVIAANGSIGGYSGGLHRKRKLLRIEGVSFQD